MKNLCLCLMPCVILLSLCSTAKCQQALPPNQPVASETADAEQLKAQQFEAWLSRKINQLHAKKEAPSVVEKVLLSRLQAERFTTDESVIAVVHARIHYESRLLDTGPGKPPGKYPQTRQLISEILPLLYGRTLLTGRLQQKKAYVYQLEQERLKEKDARDQALTTLNNVHLDVDRQWVFENLMLGHVHLALGNKREADKFYFEAFAYPWSKATGEWAEFFRNMHMSAASGRIEANRHDLKALKTIYFTPVTMAQVGEELRAAIKEAEAEQKP